jgi:histidinol-phosphatase (PHP family)
MKKENFPIEIEFGLEVDYFSLKKDDIRERLNGFDWDFLTGSIHWIDGWGFDHPKTKNSWNDKNVDEVYERYYELMIELIESGLVDTIAHPDSIKCFNYVPNKDMKQTYQDVANKMKENDVKAELNTGLHYRYGHNDLGMNDDFFQILIKEKVKMITVSDAHSPEDVGMFIKEATAKLEEKVK